MVIKGHSGTIEIEVLKKRAINSNDFWEANWLASSIKGTFPGFTANYQCNLRTDDFDRCSRELKQLALMQKQKALFKTMEEGLEMSFERDYSGAIKISGRMSSRDLGDCTLEFKYEIDNPVFDQLITDIDIILTQFPVVGTP